MKIRAMNSNWDVKISTYAKVKVKSLVEVKLEEVKVERLLEMKKKKKKKGISYI